MEAVSVALKNLLRELQVPENEVEGLSESCIGTKKTAVKSTTPLRKVYFEGTEARQALEKIKTRVESQSDRTIHPKASDAFRSLANAVFEYSKEGYTDSQVQASFPSQDAFDAALGSLLSEGYGGKEKSSDSKGKSLDLKGNGKARELKGNGKGKGLDYDCKGKNDTKGDSYVGKGKGPQQEDEEPYKDVRDIVELSFNVGAKGGPTKEDVVKYMDRYLQLRKQFPKGKGKGKPPPILSGPLEYAYYRKNPYRYLCCYKNPREGSSLFELEKYRCKYLEAHNRLVGAVANGYYEYCEMVNLRIEGSASSGEAPDASGSNGNQILSNEAKSSSLVSFYPPYKGRNFLLDVVGIEENYRLVEEGFAAMEEVYISKDVQCALPKGGSPFPSDNDKELGRYNHFSLAMACPLLPDSSGTAGGPAHPLEVPPKYVNYYSGFYVGLPMIPWLQRAEIQNKSKEMFGEYSGIIETKAALRNFLDAFMCGGFESREQLFLARQNKALMDSMLGSKKSTSSSDRPLRKILKHIANAAEDKKLHGSNEKVMSRETFDGDFVKEMTAKVIKQLVAVSGISEGFVWGLLNPDGDYPRSGYLASSKCMDFVELRGFHYSQYLCSIDEDIKCRRIPSVNGNRFSRILRNLIDSLISDGVRGFKHGDDPAKWTLEGRLPVPVDQRTRVSGQMLKDCQRASASIGKSWVDWSKESFVPVFLGTIPEKNLASTVKAVCSHCRFTGSEVFECLEELRTVLNRIQKKAKKLAADSPTNTSTDLELQPKHWPCVMTLFSEEFVEVQGLTRILVKANADLDRLFLRMFNQVIRTQNFAVRENEIDCAVDSFGNDLIKKFNGTLHLADRRTLEKTLSKTIIAELDRGANCWTAFTKLVLDVSNGKFAADPTTAFNKNNSAGGPNPWRFVQLSSPSAYGAVCDADSSGLANAGEQSGLSLAREFWCEDQILRLMDLMRINRSLLQGDTRRPNPWRSQEGNLEKGGSESGRTNGPDGLSDPDRRNGPDRKNKPQREKEDTDPNVGREMDEPMKKIIENQGLSYGGVAFRNGTSSTLTEKNILWKSILPGMMWGEVCKLFPDDKNLRKKLWGGVSKQKVWSDLGELVGEKKNTIPEYIESVIWKMTVSRDDSKLPHRNSVFVALLYSLVFQENFLGEVVDFEEMLSDRDDGEEAMSFEMKSREKSHEEKIFAFIDSSLDEVFEGAERSRIFIEGTKSQEPEYVVPGIDEKQRIDITLRRFIWLWKRFYEFDHERGNVPWDQLCIPPVHEDDDSMEVMGPDGKRRRKVEKQYEKVEEIDSEFNAKYEDISPQTLEMIRQYFPARLKSSNWTKEHYDAAEDFLREVHRKNYDTMAAPPRPGVHSSSKHLLFGVWSHIGNAKRKSGRAVTKASEEMVRTFEALGRIRPSDVKSTNALINFGVKTGMHIDGLNAGKSMIASFGDSWINHEHPDGDLWIRTTRQAGSFLKPCPENKKLNVNLKIRKGEEVPGRVVAIKHNWYKFDAKVPHSTLETTFIGRKSGDRRPGDTRVGDDMPRCVVIFFSHTNSVRAVAEQEDNQSTKEFLEKRGWDADFKV